MHQRPQIDRAASAQQHEPPRTGKPKPAQPAAQTARSATQYECPAAAGLSLKASVASLYRSFLREARRKDLVRAAAAPADHIKRRFRTDATNVGRREFQRIEFMLREGHKKLKLDKNGRRDGRRDAGRWR